MTIREAIDLALKEDPAIGTFIRRDVWLDSRDVEISENGMFEITEVGWHVREYLACLADIVADDWKVVS